MRNIQLKLIILAFALSLANYSFGFLSYADDVAQGSVPKATNSKYVIESNRSDGKLEIDLSLLAAVPSKRRDALVKMQDKGHDCNRKEFEKLEEYYRTLLGIIEELKAAYYFHKDFPKDLEKGIEEVSHFQTAIVYPFYPSSGNTAYQGIDLRNRIRMAEQLIKDMARSICEAASEPGVLVKGDKLFYGGWEWHWDYTR